MLDRILKHLEYLVACDTQNPPRAITPVHPIIVYCTSVLESCGCDVQITNLGDGCVSLLARRGHASTIVNCHLDTVPADPAWTNNPFALEVESGRAIGLGACDIKGAAACMLAAAQTSDGAMALLLSTDEEAGKSQCVRHFVSQDHHYQRAIVAEPTRCAAVDTHRGLATYELVFEGLAAHSSLTGADKHNAIHLASRWCTDAIELTDTEPFNDLRFNIGVIEGGAKPNIAASSARVLFGMRPPAWMHPNTPADALQSLIDPEISWKWKSRFCEPGLKSSAGAQELIEAHGFEPGEPVDFWTEAALFHQAGIAAIVLGPGDIAQAHSAQEFVALDDLLSACRAYTQVFSEPIETSSSLNSVASEQGDHES